MSERKLPTIPGYAPTGSDLLDLIVGGNKNVFGYPFGRIINIVGDKSSSKTFQALEIIAASRKQYGNKLKWVYDDCESGFGFDTVPLYGFEIMPTDPKERTKSDTVEDAYVNIRKFAETLKKDEWGVYVIDSLDGLSSEEGDKLANARYKAAQDGKVFDEGSYKMGKAKYLSQEFFQQLSELLEKTNVLLIIISQVRENIDAFSYEKFTRAGGKAMDFYCHTVTWSRGCEKLVRKGRVVGWTIELKTTKSKTPRPYRDGFFTLYFDYGIDNISTNVDFLYGLLTEKGALNKKSETTVSWGTQIPTVDNILDWIREETADEEFRTAVGNNYKKSDVIDWAKSHPTLGPKYLKIFGLEMSREALIDYIETNGLADELRQKVRDKWESVEDSIRTKRPQKYATSANVLESPTTN